MPRRRILTDRSRSALFGIPTDQASLSRHYTLADDDIEHIGKRRLARNQLGFALQLCAFRYPGRLLEAGETIPLEMTEFGFRRKYFDEGTWSGNLGARLNVDPIHQMPRLNT